jgi:hypothetical protein
MEMTNFALKAEFGYALKLMNMAVVAVSVNRIGEKLYEMRVLQCLPGRTAKVMYMGWPISKLIYRVQAHNEPPLPVLRYGNL